jgi:hypothetical protein
MHHFEEATIIQLNAHDAGKFDVTLPRQQSWT